MPEIRRPFQMVLPEDLCGLSYVFESAGFQLFVVGGAVRDAVMGAKPKDYDVATNATPDQVIGLLRDIRAWKIIEVGKSFGVVKARLEGSDYEYEIATFRQDVGKGRRPDSVVFTTIEEDVKRRDLTINALFYDIQRQEIVDLVGGLADIEDELIRTVGDPNERFAEDRLRVLRCLRFACKLDFDIASETSRAITNDNNLHGVSGERIRDEFVKAIQTTQSVPNLLRLFSGYHMWDHVLPGLMSHWNSQHERRYSINTNVVPIVNALLLGGTPHAFAGRCLNELKYSSEEVSQVTFLLRYRDLEVSDAYRLRRIVLSNGSLGPMMLLYAKVYAKERGQPTAALQHAFERYLHLEPVKGDDLMAEGYSGRALGEELERRELELFKELL